jgi:hypothetical protein
MSIEKAIRAKYPDDDNPMVELAAKLGFIMDSGDGSAAIARELTAVLKELRTGGKWGRLGPSSVARSPALSVVEDDEDEGSTWSEGGTWINGQKVR